MPLHRRERNLALTGQVQDPACRHLFLQFLCLYSIPYETPVHPQVVTGLGLDLQQLFLDLVTDHHQDVHLQFITNRLIESDGQKREKDSSWEKEIDKGLWVETNQFFDQTIPIIVLF